MRLRLSAHFLRAYQDAPAEIKKSLEKQVRLLMADLRHPSLHAKKYNEATSMWQARVNRGWRFYFTIEGDTYLLHDITHHPK